jgi:pre-mRNA-splicing factor ATP-dependent RNA helicase DHX15/PRP43
MFLELTMLLWMLNIGLLLHRLLEYSHNYFDLASFPDGETKRALQRVVAKKNGKKPREEDSGTERREKKKRKKT